MKQFIFTLCAISSMCGLQAKNNTYHVDTGGCVTVGASKLSPEDFNIDLNKYSNFRKPTRAEITDTDPRQAVDQSGSWFKW